MTKVTILPEPSGSGGTTYRAVAGDKQSVGHTAGEALDALTPQLAKGDSGTLVIVQSHFPDQFFSAEQQRRLAELMSAWRTARDQGNELPAEKQNEINALVEAELRASANRAAALLDELTTRN